MTEIEQKAMLSLMTQRQRRDYGIKLILEGYTRNEVADICGVDRHTVYTWSKRIPPEDLAAAGLPEVCKRGPKPLTPEEKAKKAKKHNQQVKIDRVIQLSDEWDRVRFSVLFPGQEYNPYMLPGMDGEDPDDPPMTEKEKHWMLNNNTRFSSEWYKATAAVLIGLEKRREKMMGNNQ